MGLLDRFIGPPSKDAFARKVSGALRRAGEQRPIKYDADGFRLAIGDGDRRSYHNLGNYYDEYCAAPRSGREGIVARIVETHRQLAAADLPKTFDQARARLRPRVRERFYLESRRMELELQGVQAPRLPHRPLADHLMTSLVYDLPSSMLEVGEDRLEEWGVSFEEALKTARENLWDRTKERLVELQPGLFASSWEDNYDATRLVLHDLIWQYTVRGEHVAMVPNRDTLIVTGSQDPAGLAKLFALTESSLEKPWPISGIPIRLDRDEWKAFELETWHEHVGAFRRLFVRSHSTEYAHQKELLDALHKKKGEDLFVATYTPTQHKETGEVSSYCTWTEGVPSLLPRTDKIVFVRPDLPKEKQVIGPTDWGKVQREVKDLMKPTAHYPERWRVNQFPTDPHLRYLGA